MDKDIIILMALVNCYEMEFDELHLNTADAIKIRDAYVKEMTGMTREEFMFSKEPIFEDYDAKAQKLMADLIEEYKTKVLGGLTNE